jgi:hypothetical protein
MQEGFMHKIFSILVAFVVPILLVMGSFSNPAVAQQSATKAGTAPTVLLENDKVRVYEITYKPGAVSTGVPTTAYRVVRAITGGTLLRTYADGKTETVVWKDGQVGTIEASEAYTSKNIGKTEIRFYVVQVK